MIGSGLFITGRFCAILVMVLFLEIPIKYFGMRGFDLWRYIRNEKGARKL